jgi:hypothetical protein
MTHISIYNVKYVILSQFLMINSYYLEIKEIRYGFSYIKV